MNTEYATHLTHLLALPSVGITSCVSLETRMAELGLLPRYLHRCRLQGGGHTFNEYLCAGCLPALYIRISFEKQSLSGKDFHPSFPAHSAHSFTFFLFKVDKKHTKLYLMSGLQRKLLKTSEEVDLMNMGSGMRLPVFCS